MTNLILIIAAIALAVLSLVGLGCKFINQKTTIAGYSATAEWNLQDWFTNIKDLKSLGDDVTNWEIARICLFVLIGALVVTLVVTLIAKLLCKKSAVLRWVSLGLSIATMACAVTFMVLTLVGCHALSYEVQLLATKVEYIANVGFYLFSIGAFLSSVLTAVVAVRK